MVVLPASGCEMIANVLLRVISLSSSALSLADLSASDSLLGTKGSCFLGGWARMCKYSARVE